MIWKGVIPAVTTPFTPTLSVDHAFLAKHLERMLEAGVKAFVMLGSLGEGATLTSEEKVTILETAVKTVGQRAAIVAGVPSLSTTEAVHLAKRAEAVGCQGLMVLPPYVYKGDARETEAHYRAVLEATKLDCLLYNNPVAYGTDVLPEQMLALSKDHANLKAVKESSGDARRFASIKALLGDRLALFVGMDDLAMEGFLMGTEGWIAGLVNALPEESVRLLELVQAGRTKEAFELYAWFLPLLRLDTHVKFVQYIKLVQQEVNLGSERVRPPRLELVGEERERVLALIRGSLAARPHIH
jgi:1-pyrroline-4-hydroxy-2-carboxylate deaminase